MEKTSEQLWLEKKYRALVFPVQSPDQVIKSLKNEYGITSTSYEKMDKIMQSVFLNGLKYNGGLSIDDFDIFSLSEISETQVFFEIVHEIYGCEAGVYIFKRVNADSQFPQIYSNCNILDLELLILSGINEDDVRDNTPSYFYYLRHFQMFDEYAAITWKEHFTARNCKVQ